MSATQQPRQKLTTTGVKGHLSKITSESDRQRLEESLAILDFFAKSGLSSREAGRSTVTRRRLWSWLTQTEGIDVTAVFRGTEVLGATLGFYYEPSLTYLTHLTAVARHLQEGSGLGLFLRTTQALLCSVSRFIVARPLVIPATTEPRPCLCLQLTFYTALSVQMATLYKRLGRAPMQEPALAAVSLSVLPSPTNPRGAVGFQTYFFTRVLEWTIVTVGACARLREIDAAHEELAIREVMRDDVQPLMFEDS